MGRLVRIVLALRNVGRMERIEGRDRMVVGERAEAGHDLVEDFHPVERMFHRKTQVEIVEGRGIRLHQQRPVAGGRMVFDMHAGARRRSAPPIAGRRGRRRGPRR